jgi:hypothetical protein
VQEAPGGRRTLDAPCGARHPPRHRPPPPLPASTTAHGLARRRHWLSRRRTPAPRPATWHLNLLPAIPRQPLAPWDRSALRSSRAARQSLPWRSLARKVQARPDRRRHRPPPGREHRPRDLPPMRRQQSPPSGPFPPLCLLSRRLRSSIQARLGLRPLKRPLRRCQRRHCRRRPSVLFRRPGRARSRRPKRPLRQAPRHRTRTHTTIWSAVRHRAVGRKPRLLQSPRRPPPRTRQLRSKALFGRRAQSSRRSQAHLQRMRRCPIKQRRRQPKRTPPTSLLRPRHRIALPDPSPRSHPAPFPLKRGPTSTSPIQSSRSRRRRSRLPGRGARRSSPLIPRRRQPTQCQPYRMPPRPPTSRLPLRPTRLRRMTAQVGRPEWLAPPKGPVSPAQRSSRSSRSSSPSLRRRSNPPCRGRVRSRRRPAFRVHPERRRLRSPGLAR